jgi:hypothetical protein
VFKNDSWVVPSKPWGRASLVLSKDVTGDAHPFDLFGRTNRRLSEDETGSVLPFDLSETTGTVF